MADTNSRFEGPVALSFSGGGARAAGFHMGVLSYLDHLDILKDVTILASVSGGTFVAAKYALTLKTAPEGEDVHKTFLRFFNDFYDFLLTADLVNKALAKLTAPPKTPSKHPTTVKALAEVYNEPNFINGAKFGVFWGDREIHLKNIIFNSSECKDGMAFRFQKREPDAKVGSFKVWIETDHAKEMRLADIVASSSDIPVGLEPLLFPDDFVWPEDQPNLRDEIRNHLDEYFGIKSLALVDGGVIDNQGIESVLLAAQEVNKADTAHPQAQAAASSQSLMGLERFGLYIVSDTPVVEDDIYNPQSDIKPGGGITLGGLALWARAQVVVYGIVSFLLVGALLVSEPRGLVGILLYGIPLVLVVSQLWMLLLIRGGFNKLLNFTSKIAPDMWKRLKQIRIYDLAYMLEARITSTWALTSDIFLERIRGLMYYALYASADLTKPSPPGIPNRFSANLCPVDDYTLVRRGSEKPGGLAPPTPEMQQLSKTCSHMPTTLWLNDEQAQELVKCGQMTMCFSILWHLKMRQGDKLADDLFKRASQDWEEFQKDPGALLSKYRAE